MVGVEKGSYDKIWFGRAHFLLRYSELTPARGSLDQVKPRLVIRNVRPSGARVVRNVRPSGARVVRNVRPSGARVVVIIYYKVT